jgi:hypothetical protein
VWNGLDVLEVARGCRDHISEIIIASEGTITFQKAEMAKIGLKMFCYL